MGYSKCLLIHLKWSFNAIIFSFWDFLTEERRRVERWFKGRQWIKQAHFKTILERRTIHPWAY